MPLRITSSPLVSIVMRLAPTSALCLSASYIFIKICRLRARLDRDHVRHAFHTVDPTHGVVCAFLTYCRSTRRLSVTQSGQLPGSANPSRRTNLGST
jgi:hypothetical protein